MNPISPRARWGTTLGLATAAGLVVVAACTAEADPPPAPELVGHWNGGPGDSSDWDLTVELDGSYELTNDRLGWSDSGLLDTSKGRFQMDSDAEDEASPVAPGASSGGGDPAAIGDCSWNVENLAGMVTLRFCGTRSTWVLVR